VGSFLQKSRHGTIFYFRRRVPLDLRVTVGASVVYKSLLTSDRRDAIVLARALAAKTDELFSGIRDMANKKNEEWRVDLGFSIDLDELTCRAKRVNATDVKPDEIVAAREGLALLHEQVIAKQGTSAQTAPATPIVATPGLQE